MSHHIVETRELAYTYPDNTPALRGISFRITHGESVAIIGANGAGKSTLLLHLNGSVFPQRGMVRIGDFPLTPKTLSKVRQTVGMIFQHADDQLFMPTVYEDVAFGPLNLGLPLDEVDQLVDAALKRVGALELKERLSYRLSAGEKRAVTIASVLAMSPDILVMDEPSSNLDPATRRRLIELLVSFKHTKIIATHDLDLVLEVCSRTIVLHKGKITKDGATMDVLQDEQLLLDCSLEKPLRLQGCPVCGKESS